MPSRTAARPNQRTTLNDIFFILFRQKRKLAAFFVTVVVAVFFATMLMPDRYDSTAKILIRLGRESVAMDPLVASNVDPIISVGQSRQAEIQTELGILRSRELAMKIVDKFGWRVFLEPDASVGAPGDDGMLGALHQQIAGFVKGVFGQGEEQEEFSAIELAEIRDEAANAFLESLRVEVSDNSNILTLTYEAFGPALAQNVLATLLDLFLDKHIEVYRGSESLSFFQEQSERLKVLVEADEARLNRIKMAAGTGSLPGQQTIVMNRINALTRDIEAAENSLASTEARILALRTMIRDLPERILTRETSGLTNQVAQDLLSRLTELRLREQQLLAKYKPDAQPVIAVRQEIDKAMTMLGGLERTRSETTTDVNTLRQKLEGDLLDQEADRRSHSARLISLKDQFDRAEAQLRQLIEMETSINRIERELKLHRDNYFQYSEKMEQARINRALETQRISNISVVQSPTLPLDSSRPKRKLNLALGLFLGLFGGLGLAFAADFLDQSFKKPEEVEQILDVPVLASIPDVVRSRTIRKKYGHNPPGVLVSEDTSGWHLPVSVRSQFSALRDSLCYSGVCDQGHICLMVTSSHPGEGSSSVALDLAYTLAANDEDSRALVVDANLRAPFLHKAFGLDAEPGLAELLGTGGDPFEYVRSTPINGLDVLPAGAVSDEVTVLTESRLFESKHFDPLRKKWLERYRYVIFDAAPAATSSSTLTLAPRMGGVIWVIQAEGVRRQVALYVKELFEQVEADVIGVVFNRRRYYVPQWLYKLI